MQFTTVACGCNCTNGEMARGVGSHLCGSGCWTLAINAELCGCAIPKGRAEPNRDGHCGEELLCWASADVGALATVCVCGPNSS